MSIRVDSSSLIAGKTVVSLYAGHGIQAQNVPSTGDNGAGYLYNDIAEYSFSATDELRGQILTLPSAGNLTVYEDSSFEFTGASDGIYSFTYRGFRNGVSYGDYTVTMTIGLSNYQLGADGGVFSYSGGGATLTYSSAPSAYELIAEGGVFSYSGGNAQLTFGNTLSAEGGVFTYAGGDAVFSRTYLLQASGGSFSFSGGAASLNYSAAVYSRISGYTIGYAPSGVSAQYSDN